MAEPFVFINTYTIKPGKAGEYQRECREVVDLVEAKEPRMLYFAIAISEDGTEATTVQVHADADNMAYHMELIGDHIRKAHEYLDFSTMSIQVVGSPGDALLDNLRQVAGSGVPVSVSRPAAAMSRFPAVETSGRTA